MDATRVPINDYSADYLRGAIDMALIFERWFACNGGMPCKSAKGNIKKDFQRLFFDFIKNRRNLAMLMTYADEYGFNFVQAYSHDKKGKVFLSKIEYVQGQILREEFKNVWEQPTLEGMPCD